LSRRKSNEEKKEVRKKSTFIKRRTHPGAVKNRVYRRYLFII